MNDAIRIFIGFDPREAIGYHVCQQSIIEKTAESVAFFPVRGQRRDGSNDFTYERFLVPWKCRYDGWAIFMDGDMIVRGDIAELWSMRDPTKAVQVVKHDYETKFPTKYLGNRNENYERKNWSSLVIWNCGHHSNLGLRPHSVGTMSGAQLHRFSWLAEEEIGSLPDSWNRLVMEQDVVETDRLLHFTVGLPAFPEYARCEASEEWHATYERTIAPCRR